MSFWTKFRDIVTAPVRLPVEAFIDFSTGVIRGENALQAVKESVAKGVSGVFAPQAALTAELGINRLQEKLSPYTLGITGTLAGNDAIALKYAQGEPVSMQELNKAIVSSAKSGAIVGAGVVAAGLASEAAIAVGAQQGSALASVTGVLGGVTGATKVSSFLSSGRPSDLSGIVPGLDIPGNEDWDWLKDFIPKPVEPLPASPAPYVSGYSSTQSGFDSGSKPTSLLVPAVLFAAGAYLVSRKAKK